MEPTSNPKHPTPSATTGLPEPRSADLSDARQPTLYLYHPPTNVLARCHPHGAYHHNEAGFEVLQTTYPDRATYISLLRQQGWVPVDLGSLPVPQP